MTSIVLDRTDTHLVEEESLPRGTINLALLEATPPLRRSKRPPTNTTIPTTPYYLLRNRHQSLPYWFSCFYTIVAVVLSVNNGIHSTVAKMNLLSHALTTILFATCSILPSDAFVSSPIGQQTTLTKNFSKNPFLRTQTRVAASDDSSSDTLKLFSPCKINLFLRIIRKRPDGFHDLASLFQAVGFGDTLTLSLSEQPNDEFTCNMEGVPTDSSNLVLRALELMRQKTGKTDVYFKADLFKRVPAQAGLGGGSANAATAMWGANELMGKPATLGEVSCTSCCVCPVERRHCVESEGERTAIHNCKLSENIRMLYLHLTFVVLYSAH